MAGIVIREFAETRAQDVGCPKRTSPAGLSKALPSPPNLDMAERSCLSRPLESSVRDQAIFAISYRSDRRFARSDILVIEPRWTQLVNPGKVSRLVAGLSVVAGGAPFLLLFLPWISDFQSSLLARGDRVWFGLITTSVYLITFLGIWGASRLGLRILLWRPSESTPVEIESVRLGLVNSVVHVRTGERRLWLNVHGTSGRMKRALASTPWRAATTG